jgi:hypothetical protein
MDNKRKADDSDDADVSAAAAVVEAKKRITESTATAAVAAATTTTTTTTTSYVAGAAAKGRKAKPILVILPGASGTMSQDMTNFLIPELHKIFDVRIREKKKWNGWDPIKNAKQVVTASENLCPTSDEPEQQQPWFVMGCSFGNRVAVSIVAEKLTSVAPGLILTGYPMYGGSDKGKEVRVEHLQSLPSTAKVLAISGEKDDYLTKNVPMSSPTTGAQSLWDTVLKGMECNSTTTVHIVGKAGHGVYPSAKGRKGESTSQIIQWIQDFVSSDGEKKVSAAAATKKNKTMLSFFEKKK